MRKRRRSEVQPRCRMEICRRECPYKDKPFRVDIVSLENGSDAVCFAIERTRGVLCSCIVSYLKGRCPVGELEIEKDVFGFMNRHAARVMEDCPLWMEHAVSDWNG